MSRATPDNVRAVLFSALSFLLLTGTACTHRAYHRAAEADTVDAYRAFLREERSGDHAEAARARIEELEFAEATKLHTVLAYKRFIERYPASPDAGAATARLATLRFNAAKERNTALGLRQFLAEHPDGAHREEAERLLDAAELAEAREGSATEALARSLQSTRDDGLRMVIETKLDDARFAEAKQRGASGLFAYLREVPAGVHRQEARTLLLARKVEGLLLSGLEADALSALDAHPLGVKLPELRERIIRTQAASVGLQSADVTARNAETAWHLRRIEDLVKSLAAPDPLDRWQAAEELGHHVSVLAIDPLLEAVRTQRNTRVRQEAFDSLGSVLRALPPPIREYEVASRIESLRERAAGAEVALSIAALLDLSGDTAAAAAEYQRAFEPRLPDPVVLRRWAELRRARGEGHSAAVAARQLSLWVGEQLTLHEPGVDRSTLSQTRALCAAAEASRFSLAVIQHARGGRSEFPEDLVTFEAEALAAKRLAEARLVDAELVLRQRQPDARTCSDMQVSTRLAQAERVRKEALEKLALRSDAHAKLLLERARERDPSLAVRRRVGEILSTAPASATRAP